MALSRHAIEVSSSPTFERYTRNHDKSPYEKLSCGCSTGEPIRRLPSDTIKDDVYIEYKKAWADIIGAAMAEGLKCNSLALGAGGERGERADPVTRTARFSPKDSMNNKHNIMRRYYD
eukprot:IDg3185t1